MAPFVFTLSLGACQQQQGGGGGGSTDPEEKLDASKPAVKRDGAAPKDAPMMVKQDAGAAGSGGGEGGAAGGMGGGEAGAGGPDAGPKDAGPDGYVYQGPGPFGLTARPANPSCKIFESYSTPVAKLSATGCVDAKDPTKPVPAMIPYMVASPLWSDSADKQRYMAIPDGTTIHVKDCTAEPDTCKSSQEGGTTEGEGHFVYPVGTVLMKIFLFNAKPFETRLFMKFTDSFWVGYSYQWNAQGTDADLVKEEGLNKPVMNNMGVMQNWYYPSQSDCLLCHNSVVGFSLGPETRQLNVAFKYPSGTTANQIDTLAHVGMFDAPVKKLPVLPDPKMGITPTTDDPATLDVRARSYLHANCGICHRPEGNFPGMDLTITADWKAMNVCNVVPTRGTDTVMMQDKAVRLSPGHPELSVMHGRMATTVLAARMPQVGTAIPDPIGTRLISDWIKSIPKCP